MNNISNMTPEFGPFSSDHEAVIAVIRAETQAFLGVDLAMWSECWLHDDRSQDVYISATTGLSVIRGWPAIEANMTNVFQNDLTCKMAQIRQENYQVSVNKDTAWVVFDGWPEERSGTTGLNFETRILERQSDGWKIVYSSVMEQYRRSLGNGAISVDGAGQVVFANATSLEMLKTHPILTISAGRLRAHRRDWDVALQKEIARAGRYHGFFELNRLSNETGGTLQYPVVLGNTSDGGVAVVLVLIRDCVTYLCIDVDKIIDDRLAVAQAVFGISDGQMRIASRIAAGEGLKQAAKALGISVNTARTHITRIFEKTGVKSQTALVRLLLSVG